MHGINDAAALVTRSKRVGDTPRTHVGSFRHGLKELKVPGSVSTEGWNINQDHSIVGNYKSADGRTHGFIARMASEDEERSFWQRLHRDAAEGSQHDLHAVEAVNADEREGACGVGRINDRHHAGHRKAAFRRMDAGRAGRRVRYRKAAKGTSSMSRRRANLLSPARLGADPVDTAPGAPPLTAETLNEAWAFVVSGHLEGRPAQDGVQRCRPQHANKRRFHRLRRRQLLRRGDSRPVAPKRR